MMLLERGMPPLICVSMPMDTTSYGLAPLIHPPGAIAIPPLSISNEMFQCVYDKGNGRCTNPTRYKFCYWHSQSLDRYHKENEAISFKAELQMAQHYAQKFVFDFALARRKACTIHTQPLNRYPQVYNPPPETHVSGSQMLRPQMAKPYSNGSHSNGSHSNVSHSNVSQFPPRLFTSNNPQISNSGFSTISNGREPAHGPPLLTSPQQMYTITPQPYPGPPLAPGSGPSTV